MTSDSARNVFLSNVRRILSGSAPNFDLRAIGTAGVEAGLLTAAESDVLQTRSIMPSWMRDGLMAHSDQDVNLPRDSHFSQTELVGGCSFDIIPPINGGLDRNLPANHLSRRLKVRPVYAISGGASTHYLANFRKLAWDETGPITSLCDADGVPFLPYLEHAPAHDLPGHSFLAVVEGATIYTHWLLDTLPRVLFWVDQGHDLAEIDQFVFTATGGKFHHETLDRLGIDKSRVVTRAKSGSLYRTEQFTTVTAPRSAFATHPDTYARVRSFFLKDATQAVPQKRRIYISRGKAGRRRVLNEDELMRLLDRFGVETVYLEDHSIAETAMIMAECSHIIAPHGAGLANLVFAQPGTRVIEFYSAHLSSEYWIVARQQGLEYHVFKACGPDGTPIGDAERLRLPFRERNGLNIHVPLDSFEAYLASEFF